MNELVLIVIQLLNNKELMDFLNENFMNMVETTVSKASVPIEISKSIKKAFFDIPNYLFWEKMKRYLNGTFKSYEEQIKMASRFNKENNTYEGFVNFVVNKINRLDNDEKIDYFANLSRSLFVFEIDYPLFITLFRMIENCTTIELEYIKNYEIANRTKEDICISLLRSQGIFEKKDITNDYYSLTSLGKAFKVYSLNYDDGGQRNMPNKLYELEKIKPYGESISYEIVG